jgi:hypothetical protein
MIEPMLTADAFGRAYLEDGLRVSPIFQDHTSGKFYSSCDLGGNVICGRCAQFQGLVISLTAAYEWPRT